MAGNGGNNWTVVVLEITRDGKTWGVNRVRPATLRFQDAVGEAERIAREHVPEHPRRARERLVLREDERRWLVVFDGAAGRTGHFEVRVAQAAPPSDGLG